MSLFQAYAQIVLLPLYSPQILSVFPKYVGLFSKNVGDFLKNVGLFPKNVGDFLNYLRRFFVFCALFPSYLCVVSASPFVVDCSSSGGCFVNNILVFRGG